MTTEYHQLSSNRQPIYGKQIPTQPSLSASELKFCCLLRANLSTKEISVIMGIALRSVELKKYRLKQKLNLDANSSLPSYILSI
ncbi:LuxR C-terminal-related transcriptional regulator [Bacteroides congonensis]|uniref:helix-turn-helix transcriptional regulator n=1 Tax=Bacteroides TaxID=816 RepID=UPI0032E866E9